MRAYVVGDKKGNVMPLHKDGKAIGCLLFFTHQAAKNEIPGLAKRMGEDGSKKWKVTEVEVQGITKPDEEAREAFERGKKFRKGKQR